MDTAASKMVTPVYFRPSRLDFPKRAILELTSDEMVRVTVVPPNSTPEQYEVVLNEPLANIRRLRVWRSSLMRLFIGNKVYWLDVDTSQLDKFKGDSAQYPDGLHGNAFGASEWVAYLRLSGVKASNIRLVDIGLWAAAVLFVLATVRYGVIFLATN